MVRQDLAEAWEKAPAVEISERASTPAIEVVESALSPDEKVLLVMRCSYKSLNPSNRKILKAAGCAAVITDKTIHIVYQGVFKSSRGVETIPVQTITGIRNGYTIGLEANFVEITRASAIDVLYQCNKDLAPVWASLAKDVAAKVSNGNQGSASQNSDPLDQLKKLKELLDLGVIDQAEFETKKTELLNKI